MEIGFKEYESFPKNQRDEFPKTNGHIPRLY